MPHIQYEEYNPRPETLEIIEWAERTAQNYKDRGLSLTLRQLYYQGVSQNLFPNSEASYNRLGYIVDKGRLAGLIDWALLVDRTRNAGGTSWFGHQMPEIPDLIQDATQYRTLDLWRGQDVRLEVWVEKQALEQVAQRAAGRYRVPYLACKGYMSQSEMWEAGHRRLKRYIQHGYRPIILHIGDHDPSGIDMSRDIEDRLTTFAEGRVELRRLALNMDQIDQYNPPPNPAKQTDSRFKSYKEIYGGESWELDALRPEILIELITGEIESLLDRDLFDARLKEEAEARAEMQQISDRWPEIEDYLNDNPIEEI